MNQKELAAQLKISAAMVSKLKKRGMPTGSVEAASKWRTRHLEVIRTKSERVDLVQPERNPIGHVSKASGVPLASAAALSRVRQLGDLAHDALAGNTFEIVAPMLRQAMQAVPPQAREHVVLSLEVWDALTACIPVGCAGERDGGPNEFSDSFMEVFWYQIALGPKLTDHYIVATPHAEAARNARTEGSGGHQKCA